MKRWALPVSLAVALSATTATAFAETQPIATNFRGHFKTVAQYNAKEVNEDKDGNTVSMSDPMPTGLAGAVDVDIRGDIVLSPDANNRLVLELRQRIRGDKMLDAFPTRFSSSDQKARFGGGERFQSGGLGLETDKLVDKAYFENKSSWWADGPTITTRVGRQDPNYNGWIGKIGRFDRAGVTVEGFNIGPATLRMGYIWGGDSKILERSMPIAWYDTNADFTDQLNNDYPYDDVETGLKGLRVNNVRTLILNANVPTDIMELDLTGVRTTYDQGGKSEAVFDFAVGLKAPLAEVAELSGVYARDAYHEKNAYRVELATQLGGANLSALYRDVEPGYNPIWEDRDDFMNPEERTQSKVHDERTGFKVSASGELYNWKLSGSYDSSYRSWLGRDKNEKINTIDLAASTTFHANNPVDFSIGASIRDSKEDEYDVFVMEGDSIENVKIYRAGILRDKDVYTVGLGTNFSNVRAEYELKITDEKKISGNREKKTDHTLALSAPVSVAYLDTLHLGGSVVLRDGDRKTGYGIDAAWMAKNGLRVGVHYTGGFPMASEGINWRFDDKKWERRARPDKDELRKFTYPDGTTHYLGNGLAVTAGWAMSF